MSRTTICRLMLVACMLFISLSLLCMNIWYINIQGRQELLSFLKRRRYKEMMMATLEKKSLRFSPLDMRFHLRDLIGSGCLKTSQTPSGLVVQVAKDWKPGKVQDLVHVYDAPWLFKWILFSICFQYIISLPEDMAPIFGLVKADFFFFNLENC